MSLDQFYTKPDIARFCFAKSLPLLKRLSGDSFFIEPSAGDGVFYNLLPKQRRIGLDLEPNHKEVIKRDFLKCRYRPPCVKSNAVVIGNPPFGTRGKLAIEFINKAFTIADTVAFIVPIIFEKYFIHKQIDLQARLIKTIGLPRCAFRTFNKDDYCVNTEFQVWTKIPTKHKNQRLTTPPPISHPDFKMWQYNNTKGALKVFSYPFDFGVPSQGYQDYTRRETNADNCEKHKQWILFKPVNKKVSDRLYYELDYGELAIKNTTTTPGFRKGDLVLEYMNNYG